MKKQHQDEPKEHSYHAWLNWTLVVFLFAGVFYIAYLVS